MEKRAVIILEKYEKEHKDFLVMDDFDGGKHHGLRMAIKDLKFIRNDSNEKSGAGARMIDFVEHQKDMMDFFIFTRNYLPIRFQRALNCYQDMILYLILLLVL